MRCPRGRVGSTPTSGITGSDRLQYRPGCFLSRRCHEPVSSRVQVSRAILILLAGLVLGAALGACACWLFPLAAVRVGLSVPLPDYTPYAVVMIGHAYSADGDWEHVPLRFGQLGIDDPATFVANLTERYIAEGRSPADIRVLARLAAQFGRTTPAMQPYLPPAEPAS